MYKKSSIFLAVMFYVLFLMGVAFTEEGQARQHFKNVEVTVRHGDTLWDIASLCKAKNEDVREVLDRIYKVNDIRGRSIRPGEKIVVPAQKQIEVVALQGY